ncbi:MAG: pyridoxal phosphate-dependent aminotransferase, partial [Gemmatimonadota bacterium]
APPSGPTPPPPGLAHRPPRRPHSPDMETARRTHGFTESVIREMTRVARRHGAVNLAQGFPNYPAPGVVKEAGAGAIRDDVNQYAVTWGARRLREAVADHYRRRHGMEVDPEREVTVTCGATEAMAASLMALVDPGDRVIVPEPFYENYGPDAVLCGADPVFVPLGEGPGLDPDAMADAFDDATRAVVLNTPNNPTGRVFPRDELEAVAGLCRRHDAVAVTDEIYEHLVYEGEHVPIASLPGMRERSVTVSGASKTFAVTGWRIGWIVAPPGATDAIRKVHDFLTVGAPAPLQEGVAAGMERLGDGYFEVLLEDYRERRRILVEGLRDAGFRCRPPEGAYYVLADFSGLDDRPDDAFARWLAAEVGVAPVPGSSFFSDPADGRDLVRFAFCKTTDVLEEAVSRLTAALG